MRQLLEAIKYNEIAPYRGAAIIRVRVLIELLRYIGFIGGIDIATLATGFYGFTAWTIVLTSGFYWRLHFFFSFPPLKLP